MGDARHGEWLTCEQFAELAAIPVRTARHAMKRAALGEPVKHWPVLVRVCRGRGGRSGARYEVALSSLSADLQRAFSGDDGDDGRSLAIGCGYTPAPNQSAKIERRYRVIQEAMETAPRSVERKAEVERASRKWSIPVRTIYRWLHELEQSGGDVNALAHKRPDNAGDRRVWVSRPFDKAYLAAGYPAEQLPQLGEEIDHLLRRSWTSRAQRAGWHMVRFYALTIFRKELIAKGIELPAEVITVSQRKVMQDQYYRMVDIRANDRKRYDDMKPRIRRDNTKFAPMEQIVMDVKPLDCIVRRPDGTTSWPKMIGFMDTGTHRIFRHFVLLPAGEGIRQEHVADAFLRMVADPEWGFPQQLYRDNGSEFFILDKVRDALALINAPGARTIINAKPYSGASKPIESKFATLDRFVFSQIEGWAGGNRMNKKTQTVGKPPKPYSGSFDEFVQEANDWIEIFEHQPIRSGPFKGQSPQGCFAKHVENGWRPMMVDTLALDAAFCTRVTRRTDRGTIGIDGVRYNHPELPNSREITIALPWRRDALPLALLPDFGWVMLSPEMDFLPGDISGAIESSRMQQRGDRATRRQARLAAPVATIDVRATNVTTLPTRAAPAPLMDQLASQQAIEMAEAREAGERARLDAPDAAQRRAARRMAETEELERYLASKKR